MKAPLLLMCLFLGIILPVAAQTPTWERLYQESGPTSQQIFFEGLSVASNRILFVGSASTQSAGSNGHTSYYMLNTTTGDTIWRRLGDRILQGGEGLVRQPDGRFLTAENEYAVSAYSYISTQTITASGRKGPRRRYQGVALANAFPRGLLPAPNGDYFLAIAINDFSPSRPIERERVHMARVDSLGQPRWTRDCGLRTGHYPESIQHDLAGNIVLEIADYDYLRTPFSQMRLLRLNALTGDSLQSVRLPAPAGNGNVQFNPYCEMLRLRDGGLLLPGGADTVFRPPNQDFLPFLRKVNAQLQPEWSYVYRGNPTQFAPFVGTCELADGSVLALAAESGATYRLHHISATGQLVRIYSFTSALGTVFRLSALVPVPGTRTVFVCGASLLPPSTGAYAARLDLDPTLPLVLAAPTPRPLTPPAVQLDLFPNPATTNVTLRYQVLPGSVAAALHLYDATGRLLRRQALAGRGGDARVTVAGLRPGLYLAALVAAGRVLASRRLTVAAP